MKARPSTPGSGSIVLTVAPVQALMAGVVRTVDPTAEKLKLVVPLTLKRRYDALLYMLHCPG
jgi:hypothetical protein